MQRAIIRAWTWGIVVCLVLGLFGQIMRDRAICLAVLMYLPILPVGIAGLVQDVIQKGRAVPRVRFGLTVLSVAAIGWSGILLSGGGRGAQAGRDDGTSDSIRLVQWNVMWGTRGKPRLWDTVVEDIAAKKPDIVIFSEGPSEPFRERLFQRLGGSWTCAVSKDSMRHPGYWYNMAVCSRWPVERAGEQPITTGRIMRAIVHAPGGTLRVMEVDGMSFPTWPRTERLLDIAAAARREREAGRELDLIAGDFNAVSRSVGFDDVLRAGSCGGYVRASDAANWRGTWPSPMPLYDIDHVLFSPRWRATSCDMMFNRHLDHLGQFVVLRSANR